MNYGAHLSYYSIILLLSLICIPDDREFIFCFIYILG